jgi:outer membrane receptor protein involved in Fe transport
MTHPSATPIHATTPIAGEILPGWKIIASYAYTDAEVTKDNATPVGNRFANVPLNQASLWTTYEIQTGNLKGLGFGLGLFYIGDKQGDLANSFKLSSCVLMQHFITVEVDLMQRSMYVIFLT